jgi:hypothetical protein
MQPEEVFFLTREVVLIGTRVSWRYKARFLPGALHLFRDPDIPVRAAEGVL